MDSIPDREFLEIFNRISEIVNFGGSKNPQEVKNRIKRVLKKQRERYQAAKRRSTFRKYKRGYSHLGNLYRNGFHSRIWKEAVNNPDGYIDLVLRYGNVRARKIMQERKRMRMRRSRRNRR